LFKNYRLFLSLIDYKSDEINKLRNRPASGACQRQDWKVIIPTCKNLQRQNELKVKDIRNLKQSKLGLIRTINNDREQYRQLLDELETEAAQLNK